MRWPQVAAPTKLVAVASPVTIERFRAPDDLASDDLDAVTALVNLQWSAWVAGERPMSSRAYAEDRRNVVPPTVRRHRLARDTSGHVVGTSETEWREDPGPGGGHVRVVVAADARGAGVGAAMVADVVAEARDAGRIGVTFEAAVDSDADRMCAAHGLREDMTVELNRADAREAPDAMLLEWIATGEAAAGYRLVAHDGHCPDDLAQAFVDARHVMNDAPAHEGETEHRYSVEELRAIEAATAGANKDWWTVGVLHEASGRVVGLSDLFLPRSRPWIALQGDTGVEAAHRGHRLGAWMKAVNHLRLRRERPDVEIVSTWNAASNAPMLAINRALGFRPVQLFRGWFLPIDEDGR